MSDSDLNSDEVESSWAGPIPDVACQSKRAKQTIRPSAKSTKRRGKQTYIAACAEHLATNAKIREALGDTEKDLARTDTQTPQDIDVVLAKFRIDLEKFTRVANACRGTSLTSTQVLDDDITSAISRYLQVVEELSEISRSEIRGIKGLQDEKAALQKAYDLLSTSRNGATDGHQQKLQKQLDAKKQEIDSLHVERCSLTDSKRRVDRDNDALTEENLEFRKQVKDLDAKIANMRSQRQVLHGEKRMLSLQNEALESEEKSFHQRMSGITLERDQYKASAERRQQRLEHHIREVSSLQKTLGDLTQQHKDSLAKELSQFRAARESDMASLTLAQTSLQTTTKANQELAKQNEELIRRMNVLQSSVSESVTEIANLKSKLVTMSSSNQDYKNAARASLHEYQTLKKDKDDLTAKLSRLQRQRDGLRLALDQAAQIESDLRQKMTDSTTNYDKASKLAEERRMLVMAAQKETNDMTAQMKKLRLQSDQASITATNRESELRKAAMAIDEELTATKTKNKNLTASVQDLQKRITETTTAAKRKDIQVSKEMRELVSANKVSKLENENLQDRIKELEKQQNILRNRNGGLQAQNIMDKDSMISDIKLLLGVTHDHLGAIFTRIGINGDAALSPRAKYYHGRLDSASMICGRRFLDFHPVSIDNDSSTSSISDGQESDAFIRSMCLHLIKIALCLDQDDTIAASTEYLWDLWGNLESRTITPQQISRIARPLAHVVTQISSAHVQGKVPDIAFWLATQLTCYLLAWEYVNLLMPMSITDSISRDCYPGLLLKAGHQSRAPMLDLADTPLDDSTDVLIPSTLEAERLQDRCPWFSAELNHQPVRGWVLPLCGIEEVLWALEIDGERIRICHTESGSCRLVEYGLARWIRLSACRSNEVLWMFLKEDVRDCVLDKFGQGKPESNEEESLEELCRSYIKISI
ncbi:MAG: hypothetical protein Q9180_000172 [Flavoplaca navasiana]